MSNPTKEVLSGGTQKLPMMPIRDMVIFPYMMTPFVVGRESSVRALEEALSGDRKIFLATQHDASVDEPTAGDIYTTGTIGNIVQSVKMPDGNIKVLVEGVERGHAIEINDTDGFFVATVRTGRTQFEVTPQIEQQMQRVHSLFEQYVKLQQSLNYETMAASVRSDEPAKLADTIAANLQLPIEEKQQLLDVFDPEQRLTRVAEVLDLAIEKLNMDRTIQSRVKRQMEKAQKEYYLNEKIKAIQKELGRGEKSEFDELKKKIEAAGMPKDVEEKSLQELKKLEAMPPMSAESTVSRNYLDWLLAVPWKKRSKEIRSIEHAETILNEDHYGLEKIKERILEFLAVRQLVKNPKGSILCFVGPPGVGKTSLGMSIAKATGRKFVRMSLGGVRDEAEIRGHRRTYIGALPGQIIQSMKKAGTKNPVFMLDEIDKMASDFRGDPASALLEVLDPEQNTSFQDHYLDVEYDLSQVLFVATANVLHTIPGPLQDRMEILRLHGYTELEKLEIAKQYLVKKQREATGLTEKQIVFEDDAIRQLIRAYTREAGVRNLEREIGNVCRKVARRVVKDGPSHEEIITAEGLADMLGPTRFRDSQVHEKSEVGLVTGLAWTEMGGTILQTEVQILDGKGKLTTTGQLGDVMQESAQAALSYIRSRSHQLGLSKDFYRNVDIHVHVPEGAIPKDGPSAGITLATGLASALTGVKVRRDVAMTGEITLRGKVLPIGGLKEKLLAAHRAGIYEAILPEENKKDLPELPELLKTSMKLHFVEDMDQVLQLALEGKLPELKEEQPEALAKVLPANMELPQQPVSRQ
ncbi:endopeptidase La [Edaphobacter sp. 12200R-103]|jgi:ATP-dependent Lon protease|uniref:endopeptidase La n=1 Tax=Edaphobacter sp. 12200R-103 TaxID=2703788 RepID=UPI00138BFF9B|nr:endopeptidase La [Edaphobacter sp. 12200R-103]QHS50955.1 endopeptidase La [Edaphobacter sp. 12200R-103]